MTEELLLEDLDEVDLPIEDYHIEDGQPKDITGCPLALAAIEAFGTPIVAAGWHKVSLYEDDTETLIASYTHDHTKWVISFDLGRPVEPTVVKLRKDK